jgi:hypothetical protein
VTLSPLDTIIDNGSTSMQFRLTNATLIPVVDVSVVLGICLLEGANAPIRPKIPCEGPLKAGLNFQPWWTPILWGDDAKDILLEDAINFADLRYADISMKIIFNPAGVSFLRQEKEFKFVMKTLADGRRHWITRPVSE